MRHFSFSSGKRDKSRSLCTIHLYFPHVLRFIFLFIAGLFFFQAYADGFATDLRAQGYSLIPAPQITELSGRDLTFQNKWVVETHLENSNNTMKSLYSRGKEFFGLNFTNKNGTVIVLEVKPGIISGIESNNASQGYRLEITPNLIRITGEAEAGLFYGVQSLFQLLKPTGNNTFALPEGTITDWPDLELRFIHWDTKHHQDRPETLKRYLDQAAFFKINAVAFEIEDKYEYPRHPEIGAPGAFTKAEMQELTAYALERYIQLTPVVQAPSHMTYVLKHPEFAHLRADSSNYHICMCDEEAMQLIFDMYQDMIDATPRVDYFFVSTDEVYYAGICNKCPNEYNETNRSQTWVDYVNRVHNWMSQHNRKMLAWVEYPLLPEHISQLPEGLIDAITGTFRSKEWIANENKAGIRQLAYSSMVGAELLFPNYFPTVYRNKKTEGRLKDAFDDVKEVEKIGAKLGGTFAAAWDDAGLHNETFWLGWATVTQYGWTSGTPTLEQNTADFMDAFYGADSPYMIEIYKDMEEGARFFEDIWDKKISTERKPSYGSSKGKGIHTERFDLSLDMPPLPSVDNLSRHSGFDQKYVWQTEKATLLSKKNDELINRLMFCIPRVSRNSYNLQILLSIVYLERFSINTILNLSKIEEFLKNATTEHDPSSGIKQLVEAHKVAGQILQEQKEMWNKLLLTWNESRFEKGRSVSEKHFLHIQDDVKDHFADRRAGNEFMLAPFERMNIRDWQIQLGQLIEEYAKTHHIAATGIEQERLED